MLSALVIESIYIGGFFSGGANKIKRPKIDFLDRRSFNTTNRTMSVEYKVVIMGNSRAGKTTFLNKLMHDYEVTGVYVATMGVDVRPFTLETTAGPIKFQVWDTGDTFAGPMDGYLHGADCALLFGTEPVEFGPSKFTEWCAFTNVPIVNVQTKTDLNQALADPSAIQVSALRDLNLLAPFLEAVRVINQQMD